MLMMASTEDLAMLAVSSTTLPLMSQKVPVVRATTWRSSQLAKLWVLSMLKVSTSARAGKAAEAARMRVTRADR
jgi:hypothetical protein